MPGDTRAKLATGESARPLCADKSEHPHRRRDPGVSPPTGQ